MRGPEGLMGEWAAGERDDLVWMTGSGMTGELIKQAGRMKINKAENS